VSALPIAARITGAPVAHAPWLLAPASLIWAWVATQQHERLDRSTSFLVLNAVTGLLLVGAGIALWRLRPGNRTWWLLVLAGFTWFVGSWSHDANENLRTLCFAFANGYLFFLAWAVLGFPTGRLAGRADRVALGVVAGALLGRAAAVALLNVPSDPAGYGTRNRFLPISDPTYWNWSEDAFGWAITLANLGILAVVTRHWWTLSRPGRRTLAPALVAASALAAAQAVEYVVGWNVDVAGTGIPIFYVSMVATCVVVVALLLGMLRLRGTRSSVIDLVGELGEGAPPPQLEAALRRALGDPSLVLMPWSKEHQSYLDADGQPAPVPVPGPARTITRIGDSEAPVAALVHDAALHEDSGLIDAVVASVRLTVDNDRMQAEIRAQLAEVADSRARILLAADAERRRIERDLHDGAQQRLVALGLALRLAETRADPQTEHHAVLRQAADELAAAIKDLRDLAHGIHPSVLTDSGLAVGIQSLADRAPVPVSLDIELDREPGLSVAAAAYFTVAEALTNVAKHARASRAEVHATRRGETIVLSIADDGDGGVDPSGGTGIRGIVDRVEAVGGTIRVHSPTSGGTRIDVELPCELS